MRRLREAVMALAVVLVLNGYAAAQDGPPGDLFRSLSLGTGDNPIEIHADSLELDYKASEITYRGRVEVTQGDVRLQSDSLSITYAPEAVSGNRGDARGRIQEVVATGNVHIRQGDRRAEGETAVFDHAAQTVVLRGGAVLSDGPNQITGEHIVVYLQEERSVVEGGSNSRVRAVLYPDGEVGEQLDGAAIE